MMDKGCDIFMTGSMALDRWRHPDILPKRPQAQITLLFTRYKTVVLKRDAYGEGRHRFQPAFWDFARHCGFHPKLCRPYRAKTKGKVERFNGYLRRSFYNPLATRYRQMGLVLDVPGANMAVWRWLNEVANQRQHGTTGLVPAQVLSQERELLLPLPAIYPGRLPQAQPAPQLLTPAAQVIQLQHPLSVYDQLLEAVA
jgi:hypothetical protein